MPETALTILTDATFAPTVRNSRMPVVVDFWAEWCPPCGPMARHLAELAGEFEGRLLIAKVNADENPETMRLYRVMSMPTLLFFEHGTVVNTLVGLRPKAVLRQALSAVLTPYVNS
ncbi:thioredoxin domain-containing protein [Actinoplanes sp. NPDC051411]|uniref:thioredoxin family protein n=1 Tax=Actinoplanes sp. NPDC051411 TaxID=3155522 RepID=UPI00341E441E